MAALTANTPVEIRAPYVVRSLVLAQAAEVFEGAILVYSTAANGVVAGDGSGGGSGAEFAGIALEHYAAADITAGTTRIKALVKGEAKLPCSGASAQASQGQAAYYDASAASDNPADLVLTAATGDTVVGVISEYVDSTDSWVDIGLRAVPDVGP